jgi:hypothetical protein
LGNGYTYVANRPTYAIDPYGLRDGKGKKPPKPKPTPGPDVPKPSDASEEILKTVKTANEIIDELAKHGGKISGPTGQTLTIDGPHCEPSGTFAWQTGSTPIAMGLWWVKSTMNIGLTGPWWTCGMQARVTIVAAAGFGNDVRWAIYKDSDPYIKRYDKYCCCDVKCQDATVYLYSGGWNTSYSMAFHLTACTDGTVGGSWLYP